MPSSTKHAALVVSPASNVPYDVLHEIFKHCMPEYPFGNPRASPTDKGEHLKQTFPNYSRIPMLLSQVCSAWRTVSFTAPSLWSHLRHTITLQRIDAEPGYAVLKKDLHLITFWEGNQGSTRLLDITWVEKPPNEIDPEDFEGGDSLELILSYLASAQYISIDPNYWRLLHKKKIIPQNVRALVIGMQGDYENWTEGALYGAPSFLISNNRSPSLQYLAVNFGTIRLDAGIVPKAWSSLTHILIRTQIVSISFWYTFIRNMSNLQWGYFEFDNIVDLFDENTWPIEPDSKCTLAYLKTLVIASNDYEFKISLLFEELYLPAVETLSLTSLSDSWEHRDATYEIHKILQCTPKVRTLALGESLFNCGQDSNWDTLDVGIMPIWTYAPHLKNLHLELPYGREWDASSYSAGERLHRYAQNILTADEKVSDKWLALHTPECPIRVMTLILSSLSNVTEDEWQEIWEFTEANELTFEVEFKSTCIEKEASKEYLKWGAPRG